MTKDTPAGTTRRIFLATSAAFGAGLLSAPGFAQDTAFGAAPSGLPAPDGPLRWLDSGDQKAVFMREYLPKFGEARGIEVVYDGLPWNDIATVLPLGIRNDTAPDAFTLPQGLEPSIAIAEGWIQPLEEFVPDFEEWKAAYPEGSFVDGINVFDGKTYGFPFSTERRFNNALLFNRQMMSEAGYGDVGPDSPLTFDQMRDAAAKITKNAGGASFGFIIGGNQIGRWGNIATVLAQRAGASVGAVGLLEGFDFTTGEYVYGGDEYVSGVELLLAMKSDGTVFPGALSINAPQARSFITQGAAGMIIQGPWNIPIWEAQNPTFDFGVSPAPAPEGMLENPVWVSQLPNAANMIWLNRSARNPAYVGDFFRWLGSAEGQVVYASVVSSSDPAIFPEASAEANLSERALAMINMAEKYVRISPNPSIRNPEVGKVAVAYVDPTPNMAQAVQGLFAGQLSDVRQTLQGVADARNKALDDAIAKARTDGANVSREDFVFTNWQPSEDYGPANYSAL